jgi:hypothetical protein
MTFARGQVKRRNVVCAIAVLELNCARPGSQSEQLMAHANTHDGNLRALHQLAEMIHRLLAVRWITWTIGDEDSIEVMRHLVNRIIEREGSDRSSTADKAPKNVLLDTAIDQCHVKVAERGVDMERSLGADTSNEVDTFRIDVSVVLILIILLSDGDPGK